MKLIYDFKTASRRVTAAILPILVAFGFLPHTLPAATLTWTGGSGLWKFGESPNWGGAPWHDWDSAVFTTNPPMVQIDTFGQITVDHVQIESGVGTAWNITGTSYFSNTPNLWANRLVGSSASSPITVNMHEQVSLVLAEPNGTSNATFNLYNSTHLIFTGQNALRNSVVNLHGYSSMSMYSAALTDGTTAVNFSDNTELILSNNGAVLGPITSATHGAGVIRQFEHSSLGVNITAGSPVAEFSGHFHTAGFQLDVSVQGGGTWALTGTTSEYLGRFQVLGGSTVIAANRNYLGDKITLDGGSTLNAQGGLGHLDIQFHSDRQVVNLGPTGGQLILGVSSTFDYIGSTPGMNFEGLHTTAGVTLNSTGSTYVQSGTGTVTLGGIVFGAGRVDTLNVTSGTFVNESTYGLSVKAINSTNPVVNNGLLTVTSTGYYQVGATLVGTGVHQLNTTGTISLHGTDNAGTVDIRSGVLSLDHGGSLGSANLAFTGGILQYTNADTSDYSSRFSTQSGQFIRLDTNGHNIGWSANGPASGNFALEKMGAGKLTMSGSHSFNQGVTLTAGELYLQNPHAIGTGSDPGTIFFHGGTLNLAAENGVAYNDLSARFSSAPGQQFKFIIPATDIYHPATMAASMTSQNSTLDLVNHGTLFLTGSNNFGNVAMHGGSTVVMLPHALGTSEGDMVLDGATIYAGFPFSDVSKRDLTVTAAGATLGTLQVVFGEGNFRFRNLNLNGDLHLDKASLHTSGTSTLTRALEAPGGSLNLGADALLYVGVAGQAPINLDFGAIGNNGRIVMEDKNTMHFNHMIGSGTIEVTGSTATINGLNTASGGTLLGSNTVISHSSDFYGGVLHVNGGTVAATAGINMTQPVMMGTNGFTFYAFAGASSISRLSAFAGSGTFTKTGAGRIIFTGGDTFLPHVVVQEGSLRIDAGSNLHISNGSLAGTLVGDVISDGTLTLNLFDFMEYAGSVSGSGGLTVMPAGASSGTMSLRGALTYSGTTVIPYNVGLRLSGTTGSSLAGPIVNGHSLTVDTTGGVNLGGVMSGTGSVVVQNGAAVLAGNNTYSGGTVLNGGQLGISHDNALGSGLLTINGGTIRAVGTGHTIANYTDVHGSFTIGRLTNFSHDVHIYNPVTITASNPDGPANGDSIFTGRITAAGLLTIAESGAGLGTGSIAFAGQNSLPQGIALASGRLRLDNLEALGNAGTIYFHGGYLRFTSINHTDYSPRFSTADNQLYNLDTNNEHVTLVAPLTSHNGILTKIGSGTLTLSGSNTYSGGTVVKEGTLAIDSAVRLGAGSLTLDGGNLEPTTSFTTAVPVIMSYGDGTIHLLSGNYLTLTTPVTGPGQLRLTGGGLLTLSGSQNFVGDMRVQSGTLKLQNGHLSSPTINISSGAEMLFTGSSRYDGDIVGAGRLMHEFGGTLTLTGTATHTGGTVINSGGELAIGIGTLRGQISGDIQNAGAVTFNRSDASTYNGSLSGTGAITKMGAGTLTLSGSSTSTGAIALDGGYLSLANTHALGNAGTISFTGGGLQYTTANVTDYSSRFSNAANQHYLIDTNGQAVDLHANLTSSNGTFTKVGAGVLELHGNNTYSGGTIVKGGSLWISSDSNVGSGGLTLDGGTLRHSTIFTSALSLTIAAGGGTLDATNGMTLLTSMKGSGPLATKNGLVYLFGNHEYSGNLTVESGELRITAGSINAASINLSTPSTSFYLMNATHFAGNLVGSGTFHREFSGATVFTGSAANTIHTLVSSGTLQIGDGGAGGYVPGAIVNNGVVAINRTGTMLSTGAISGNGSVHKLSPGALVISGSNSYSGGTIMDGGLLGISNDHALGSGLLTIHGGTLRAVGGGHTLSNAVTLTGDFTLGRATNLAGAITLTSNVKITSGNPDADFVNTSTLSGNIAGGAFSLAFDEGAHPIGAIVLSGSNVYSGGTHIQSGTIRATNSHALGSGAVTVSAGTLVIEASGGVANQIVLSGGSYQRVITGNIAHAVDSSGAPGARHTTSQILAGNSGTSTTLATAFSSTSMALNDGARRSDVYSLHGTGSNIFVLELSMTSVEPGSYLAWLNSSDHWVNAVTGNIGNNATGGQLGYSGSFSQFQLTYTGGLSTYIGAWGYTSTGVWAVLNHNSDFSIVPEPSTAALLALGGLSLFARRRKRSSMTSECL